MLHSLSLEESSAAGSGSDPDDDYTDNNAEGGLSPSDEVSATEDVGQDSSAEENPNKAVEEQEGYRKDKHAFRSFHESAWGAKVAEL